MYVKVHVYPGMKKEKVTKKTIDSYELVLRAPAERNAANQRTREIVAELYKVRVSSVRIIAGHRSPSKVLEIID